MTSNESTDPVTQWRETERRLLLAKLLNRREELASVAVEHTSHELPGDDLLWQAVQSVEDHIRDEFLSTWIACSADWAARDAARLHSVESAEPGHCRLCAAVERARTLRVS